MEPQRCHHPPQNHVLTTPELRRAKPDRADFVKRDRHPVTLILDVVRQNYNLGAIFRLCDGFLAERLVLIPRPDVDSSTTLFDYMTGTGELVGTLVEDNDPRSDARQRADAQREYGKVLSEVASSGALEEHHHRAVWGDAHHHWREIFGQKPQVESRAGQVLEWLQEDDDGQERQSSIGSDSDRRGAFSGYFASASESYERGGVGNVRNLRFRSGRFIHQPRRQTRATLRKLKADSPNYLELSGPHAAQEFHGAIAASKASNHYGAAITLHEPHEYEGMRKFVSEDGKAGFALDGDNIVGDERSGVSGGALALADQSIAIPMLGMANSLNVGSAAAIMLHELMRRYGKRGEAPGNPPLR